MFSDAEVWEQSTQHSYAGWIPTVTGNLSYQIVGRSSQSRALQLFNHIDLHAPRRFIAALQRRITADLPLPTWLIKCWHPGAQYDCVMLARTHSTKRPCVDRREEFVDEMGCLTGVCYIFMYIEDRVQRRSYEDFRSSLAQEILIAERQGHETTAEAAFARIAEHFDTPTELQPHGKVYFRLYRTGEIRLWSKDDSISGLPVNTDAADAADSELARIALLEILFHSAYAYIKDLCHRHYHHSERSDKILHISKVTPTDDISWRRDTLYALARSVLELRRHDQVRPYRRSAGILAYADAFQSSLARQRRDSNDFAKILPLNEMNTYDFSHTRSSIEAKEGEIVWRQNMGATTALAVLSALLGFVAIWAGLVQIRASLCDGSSQTVGEACERSIAVPERAALVGKLILQFPEASLALLGLIVVISLEWNYRALSTNDRLVSLTRWLKGFSYAAASSLANALGFNFRFDVDRVVASLLYLTLGSAVVFIFCLLLSLTLIRPM